MVPSQPIVQTRSLYWLQLECHNSTLQSKSKLQATPPLSVKMHHSKTDMVSSTLDKSRLLFVPQLPELSFLVNGGPLTSHPPQLPEPPSTLRRSNAVRVPPTTNSAQMSSTILTATDIESAAVPEPPANHDNNRRRRQSPVRNFSLPTHHPEQPRTAARYYTSALSEDEHAALARGDINHNLISWTQKDLTLAQQSSRDLMPLQMYAGPDNQTCIIPLIIVTEGQSQGTHIRQLRQQLHASRPGGAPSCLPVQSGPIARARAQANSRTADDYFSGNHRPISCRPSRQVFADESHARSFLANEVTTYRPSRQTTFGTFLTPHPSGKGEVYRDSQNAERRRR
ncbi:hypothetical protein OPT61_g8191 [Boeremia exigua]|uniref:Uncharacterized protein n=1 Tax=Boeremia exigua TaxID=749465 RepID=A0ACC2HZ89_9PLEO|nr:hypothetical protein OPT61_g8191 [Boeremia exigua]